MRTAITRILVPTDFSATADAALHYAKILASRLGASLEVLHVIDDQYLTGSFTGETYVPEVPNLRATLIQEAERELALRLTPEDKERLQAHGAVVVGRTFQAIVEHAMEQKADLIVMGTHGRTGVAHLFLGSVAERIVRTAPCPVLTIRDAPVTTPEPVRVPVISASTVI